jgi:DNA-binding response OmpR family regulator
MHILFVDDNFDTRSFFQMAIRLKGHEAMVASNGYEAVKLAEAMTFDAIVLDLETPVLNGVEAMSKIRCLPNGANIPIVIFTAYRNVPEVREAREWGADMVLYKPMLPDDLILHLEKLVARREAENADPGAKS